ncbi:MAG: Cys-tRNA(Pro) deacylase [Oscillospiraceae bacterium]
MAKRTDKKTNALRILDGLGIPYETRTYPCDGVNFDGVLVAEQVGLPPSSVFKTLLCKGDKAGEIAVCVIPVDKKLDLKALAAAHGVKRLEMAHLDELLPLTGYIRGGCSPVGMKKHYPTYIDSSVQNWETVAVSAGLRGLQMLLRPADLIRACSGSLGSFGVELD